MRKGHGGHFGLARQRNGRHVESCSCAKIIHETNNKKHNTILEDNDQSFVWFYCIKKDSLLFSLLN